MFALGKGSSGGESKFVTVSMYFGKMVSNACNDKECKAQFVLNKANFFSKYEQAIVFGAIRLAYVYFGKGKDQKTISN